MDVDDPQTTNRRRSIIQSKLFLKKIYQEWSQQIRENIPGGGGCIVELGSGAGFMKECIPEVITTDVLDIEGVDLKLAEDGKLPLSEHESIMPIAYLPAATVRLISGDGVTDGSCCEWSYLRRVASSLSNILFQRVL